VEFPEATHPHRSLLLAGATGLVGGHALRLAMADPRFDRVVILTRRPLPDSLTGKAVDEAGIEMGSGLDVRIVDFDALDEAAAGLPVDAVACALGTTIKKAGSREAFRKVDRDYPVRLAELAARAGADRFVLVSSAGASPRSRFFYSRVKGESEAAVVELGIPGVSILRPSLLLGDRAESRPGEEWAKRLSFLLPPGHRAVHSRDVARALLDEAARPGVPRDRTPGKTETRILENREIRALRQK
jgi:uncharacterized protein YbjT (DUF2867 family)